MALVYLRTESNNKNRDGYIINTKNIESFVKLIDTDILKFRVYLINGENYDFNQLYYEGNRTFIVRERRLLRSKAIVIQPFIKTRQRGNSRWICITSYTCYLFLRGRWAYRGLVS
jgi:hypothetical protein